MSYTRYTISFESHFLSWFTQSWYRIILYLDARPGSAGKVGRAFWSFDIGGEKYPEQTFAIKVLNPVKLPEKSCREFSAWVCHIQFNNTPFGRKDNRNFKFWDSLAKIKFIARGSYRDRNIPYPGFETYLFGGGNLFCTHWGIRTRR